jgi:hypothetical protein
MFMTDTASTPSSFSAIKHILSQGEGWNSNPSLCNVYIFFTILFCPLEHEESREF